MQTSYKIALAAAVGLFLIVVAYISIPGGATGNVASGPSAGDAATAEGPSANPGEAGDDAGAPSMAQGPAGPGSSGAGSSAAGGANAGADGSSSGPGEVEGSNGQMSELRQRLANASDGDATPGDADSGGQAGSPPGTDRETAGTGESGPASGGSGDDGGFAASSNRSPFNVTPEAESGSDEEASSEGSAGSGSGDAEAEGDDASNAAANTPGSTDGGRFAKRETARQSSGGDRGGPGLSVTADGDANAGATAGEDEGEGETSSGSGGDQASGRSVPETYTVEPGDTTWSIARQFYGDGKYLHAVAEANPMTDPTTIQPGDELRLPPKSDVVASDDQQAGASQASGSQGGYEVKPGETLSDIARRRLGDPRAWRRIYEANKERIGPDPDRVQAGTKLVIPSAQDGDGN